MKKILTVVLILTVAVMLFACKKAPAETPQGGQEVPPAPTPPTNEETGPAGNGAEQAPPAEGNIEDYTPGAEKVWGDVEIPEAPKVNEVFCDFDNNKITFTFENNGNYDWQLDQDVPFPPPAELRAVRIFVNGYEANDPYQRPFHPDTGEPMFGPNEKFSDNCGGTTVLKKGEQVTCTLTGVKLNRGTGTDTANKINEIWIDSPAVDDTYILFKCGDGE